MGKIFGAHNIKRYLQTNKPERVPTPTIATTGTKAQQRALRQQAKLEAKRDG